MKNTHKPRIPQYTDEQLQAFDLVDHKQFKKLTQKQAVFILKILCKDKDFLDKQIEKIYNLLDTILP